MPRWLALTALLVAVGSFFLGWWSYCYQGHERASEGAFHALQLFHLHFHPLHGEVGTLLSGGGRVTVQLEAARFGAGIIGLGLLPSMLAVSLFKGDWRRICVKYRWKGHVIVCGHCSRTMSFIRDLQLRPATGKRPRVVFIGQCPSRDGELPARVHHLDKVAQTGDLLAQAGVHRAARLVALNEDDRSNLEVLIAAGRCCDAKNCSNGRLECYAHLQDGHLQTGLDKSLGETLTDSPHLRVHLFNYYETAARELARSYPLPESMVDVTPPPDHCIIIGFGSFGQNVALKLVKMGQQLVYAGKEVDAEKWNVVRPWITVVDSRGDQATAPFLRAHPDFTSHCAFQLYKLSCASPHFLDLSFLTAADAGARTSLIFCLENETVSLRTALLLQEICRTSQKAKDVDAIYLRLAHPERLGEIVTNLSATTTRPALKFFAPDSVIFSTDAIFNQRLDLLAMAMHAAWLPVAAGDRNPNNPAPALGKEWDDLPGKDRESNREAADHMWAKLSMLGYELSFPPSGQRPATDETLLAELREREDYLARVEHHRWMTWKWLNGTRYGDPRTFPTPEEKAAGVPEFHPLMVPYEQLDSPAKERDKVNVRVISRLLREGVLYAVKRPPGGRK